MTKRKPQPPTADEVDGAGEADATAAPTYTPAELLEVQHLGPGMIGQAMYDAKETYLRESQGGILGPAMRGELDQGAR